MPIKDPVARKAWHRWWKKNLSPYQRYTKRLWWAYGLTMEDFWALRRRQKGRCAICRRRTKKRLHIDHCHRTNRIRGLLCFKCNAMIGLADESLAKLKSAIRYLGNFD